MRELAQVPGSSSTVKSRYLTSRFQGHEAPQGGCARFNAARVAAAGVQPLSEDEIESLRKTRRKPRRAARGLEIAARYGFSVVDSMIVAAVLLSGCDTLYSEDLHHRQRVDELLIRNPFAAGKQVSWDTPGIPRGQHGRADWANGVCPHFANIRHPRSPECGMARLMRTVVTIP